jgi:glycosyltransferase involved in cell wall biosynthesis
MAAAPEIAVVVGSHDRPLRLRWLLNALAGQTLARERFEVVVGHDSAGAETGELLRSHELARDGTLRHVTLPAGSAPPGANRNAALKLVRAPLVAFTDDDCRPPADWLERALEAAARHPGAIVQGRTIKDPEELAATHAPNYHSQRIDPPSPWGECANILYPREWLDRAGGFREDTYTGEDTDLLMRCRKAGARYLGDPSVLTYHAIVETNLLERLRGTRRWGDLPLLLKRHPEMRDAFPMWIFWKRTHVWLPFFAAGLVLGQKRHLGWTALCVPWLLHGVPVHGTTPRGRMRELSEVPGRLLIETAEFAVLAAGSVRHGSVLV